MENAYTFDDMVADVHNDKGIDESTKRHMLLKLAKLQNTKVNILITGATGCGKSSTINALFNSQQAKVGQGVDPETMDISYYEFNNIVLFDSPGLGDGKEKDDQHASNIIAKLNEMGDDGELLIDLVLVILDGSSRDLGTSYDLINQVIIPHLGEDTSRLLVAINQADMAMKGRGWNHEQNRPEPSLEKFLEEKVESTRRRILEATGVEVEPIYYAAGYKDGDDHQHPYNLSKLLLTILRHTKPEKRAAFITDINRDKANWKDDDKKENYRTEIKKTMLESITEDAKTGGDLGEDIGGYFGKEGKMVGRAIGTVAGAAVGFAKSLFSLFD